MLVVKLELPKLAHQVSMQNFFEAIHMNTMRMKCNATCSLTVM